MGLAGQHTPALNTWNTFEVCDEFSQNPVQSGFYASGIAQPIRWTTGPSVPPTQCSGVTFQNQSGVAFAGALLTAPQTIGAEGTASTKEFFSLVSGGSLYGRARVIPQEITSGGLCCGFGFFSAPLQSGIINAAGGALRASGNAIMITKLSGQGVWSLSANVQTSGLSVPANNTVAGGTQSGQAADLQLFVNPDRGNVQITGMVNGVWMKNNVTDLLPITLKFPVDATPMAMGVAQRMGVAEAEGLLVDKALGQQTHNYP